MSTRVCDVQSRRLMLTHLDQVWWPEAEITKEELLEHYTRVAHYLPPFTANPAHRCSCPVEALDRPDQLLFDLDPIEIAFREVRNAALLVRNLLRQFKVRAWGKTTRGRGLHVMVPLTPQYSFGAVRTAA